MKFHSLALGTLLLAIPSIGASQIADLSQDVPSSASCTMTAHNNEPNPPVWPDSVHIFHDTDDPAAMKKTIQATEDGWNEEFQGYTCDHHFSSRRHALLFAPGTYRGLDFEVGYYTQVLGLGVSPDDVEFRDCQKGPHVPAVNHHVHTNGTSLDTFWRSAENFASHASGGMRWAVSQAAPLRRVHVANDLYLFDGTAYASGGHLANARIDGTTYFGGQQQWMSRNVHFQQGTDGGAWSLVFVGCTGEVPEMAPGSQDEPSMTVTKQTPVRMEKPYVALQKDRVKFDLRVPLPLVNHEGPLLDGTHEDVRDFSRVHVARATDSDVTRSIQDALDAGKDVVLAPGIFELSATLHVRKAHQVILGLGLATLVAPSDGSPCIHVAPSTPGVRIAGVMLEAPVRDDETLSSNNDASVSSLLEWGDEGVADAGVAEHPGGLFDVFCRVGGATTGARDRIFVDTMVRIHSGNVVGDNLWLWRADHGQVREGEVVNYPHISPLFHQSEEHEFRAETGIQVDGDDVIVYGLAVEHANGHQTIWNGERGQVHFYQCELPYGVHQQTFGDKEYLGYLVNDHVKTHSLLGAGVYSNFRNEEVTVSTGIRHPEGSDIQCINPFIVRLDNHGCIGSIVNGRGSAASVQGKPVRLS